MLNTTTATGAMAASNYLEKFTNAGDELNNDYEKLFRRFAPDNTPLGSLMELLATSDGSVPMVLLGLVEEHGRAKIKVMHRFTDYRRGLEASPHDGKTFVFVGDVVAGQQIEMSEVRGDVLEVMDEVQVRSTEAINAAVEMLGPEEDLLESVADDEEGPDLESIKVRKTVPVPHCYLHMVLGNDHVPKVLWKELIGAISIEDRLVEMKPLVDWMRAAIHKEEDEETGIVSFGEYHAVLPPAVGRQLLSMRHSLLREDLGLTSGAPTDPSAPVIQVLEHMELSQSRERARQRAEKLSDKAPKTPSEVYPETSVLWKLVAGVDSDENLPEVYHRLANVPKKESTRDVVQGLVAARSRNPDSATKQSVLLTKEVFDMIKTAQFGAQPFCDDLTAGINPFTCGFGKGPKTKHIQVRTEAFDSMARGDTRPTMAEQSHFHTKEVVLPDEPYLCQQMSRATSVIIDLIQGPEHPHAERFREFATDDIEEFVNIFRDMSDDDQLRAGNVYPLALREVQLMMNGYYSDLLAGKEPDLPKYNEILGMARRRKWNLFAPLPSEYLLSPAQMPTQAAGGAEARTPGTGGNVTDRLNLGSRVENPRPLYNWQRKFRQSGKELSALTAPKDERGNDLCMSWHLRGYCYGNCTRKATHCMLVGSPKTRMQSMVDRLQEERTDGPPGSEAQGAGANGPENARE